MIIMHTDAESSYRSTYYIVSRKLLSTRSLARILIGLISLASCPGAALIIHCLMCPLVDILLLFQVTKVCAAGKSFTTQTHSQSGSNLEATATLAIHHLADCEVTHSVPHGSSHLLHLRNSQRSNTVWREFLLQIYASRI